MEIRIHATRKQFVTKHGGSTIRSLPGPRERPVAHQSLPEATFPASVIIIG